MIVVREDFPAPLKAEMPHESRRLSGRFRAGITQFQPVTFCQFIKTHSYGDFFAKNQKLRLTAHPNLYEISIY